MLETLTQKRSLLQRSLHENQVESVLSDDFDAMTYTTFHEHYYLDTGRPAATEANAGR